MVRKSSTISEDKEHEETELGLLPKEWEVVKLGEVASDRKKSVKPSETKNDIYIGLEHILPDRIKITKYGNPSDVRSSKNVFYKGDILYGKLRPYLNKVALALHDGICSTDIVVIIPEKIHSEYLGYFMKSRRFLVLAVSTMTGVNHPRTSWNKIRSFSIPLPPLAEQKNIAFVLSTIQEAKERTEQVINATRELKKSLMKHLFKYGPVSLEDAEKVKLKETEIGGIPEEWGVKELGELIIQAQYGLSHKSSAEGQYPIIGMNHLENGRVNTASVKYVDLDEKTHRKFQLKRSDILFNRTNSIDLVGKTALFDSDIDCVFASYLIRIVPKHDLVDPGFMNYYMNLDNTQSELKKLATRAVGQCNISATRLKSLRVPLPSLPVQKEIASILSAVDEKIEKLENKRRALEELFKSMLENLMTARIRVNHLEVDNGHEKTGR